MRARAFDAARRAFMTLTVGATFAALPSCRSHGSPPKGGHGEAFDVIVVGSGAGGGPLAARLARAGKRVLLLEAGRDTGGTLSYEVPARHALATEDPQAAWWYFVQHHADASLDEEDTKHRPEGILYPRGSALGGSTAVNAMVTVLPSRSDWDRLAELTGDAAFRADAMEATYLSVREWLGITLPDPGLALGDARVTAFLTAASHADDSIEQASTLTALLGHDMNEALLRGETTGFFRLPLATRQGTRNGPRERVKDTVAAGYPLTVRTGAFVTRVVWNGRRAAGVEYVRADDVFQASLAPKEASLARETALAGEEIVLAAGAFNSPQLLQLSGVGDELTLARLGITPVVPRRGVGRNLQDRVEAPVVTELDHPLDVVAHCRLGESPASDPCMQEWQEARGVYTTSGFLATLLTRSTPDSPVADLQIFAAPTDARGYYPGYAEDSANAKNRFTWLILKGHTKNRDGVVQLRDTSAFHRPHISFNSFDESLGLNDPDLLAVVAGIKRVRDIVDRTSASLPADRLSEVWPGRDVATDEDLARFVFREHWGHHACCTDKMGRAEDPDAVVDSHFRVIGAEHLRVVDASVFPEIPGTFIALPTYMISEKAAQIVLEDDR